MRALRVLRMSCVLHPNYCQKRLPSQPRPTGKQRGGSRGSVWCARRCTDIARSTVIPSPQGAGNSARAGIHPNVKRSIPAGAGNRLPATRPTAIHWEHPCGCGEQIVFLEQFKATGNRYDWIPKSRTGKPTNDFHWAEQEADFEVKSMASLNTGARQTASSPLSRRPDRKA